jgi:Flp pilus assembly protein TadB
MQTSWIAFKVSQIACWIAPTRISIAENSSGAFTSITYRGDCASKYRLRAEEVSYRTFRSVGVQAWPSIGKRRRNMLWALFVILLILWLVGFIAFHVVAWYIHLLLVVALVVLVLQLLTGRRPVV